MSITITVPNDDHVALRAMAKALEEIAVARGAAKQSTQIGELNYKINIDTTQATAALGELSRQVDSDTTSEQFDSLVDRVEDLLEVAEQPFQGEIMPTTDSTGTPWDERIHSASKALNADGTWRLRRKPASKDVEEWAAEVEQVLTELTQPVQTRDSKIDPTHYAVETADGAMSFPEPEVTLAGDDFHVGAGEVTEQQIAAIPLPPVPVVEEKTAPLGHEHAHMSFPDVMKFLTERHTRITNDQVLEIIGAMGLKNIMDLNTQPEHTGPFIARVKALLGE